MKAMAPGLSVCAPRRQTDKPLTVSFVAPCYNEEANVEAFIDAILGLWDRIKTEIPSLGSCEIVLVDDGSSDSTWDLIRSASRRRPEVVGVRLSRNFGHQAALLSGLMTAGGDAVISLDADLQDDIEVIPAMLCAYVSGDEIVFGVRSDRSSDSVFKRISAHVYYRLLGGLGVDSVYNHADFRLMSRKALDALMQYGERNLYLRGLIKSFGFRTSTVEYERKRRERGQSAYTLRKMIVLGLNGITAFSVRPLRLFFYLGMAISTFSLGYIIYSVVMAFMGVTISGWASLVVSIYLIGGIQIIGIGILGEYIGRIYIETKGRPHYLVEEIARNEEMDR